MERNQVTRVVHDLKTDTGMFEDALRGIKGFELRKNDRNFRIGDVLVLHETTYTGYEMTNGKPLEYTGRTMSRTIIYILSGYGMKSGFVILGCIDGGGF